MQRGPNDRAAAFRLMMVGQIPTMVDSAAKAISNIKLDKVVVRDGGDGGTAGFVQNMVRALPPMMSVIEEVGGMKLPGFVGTRIETRSRPRATVRLPPTPFRRTASSRQAKQRLRH